MFIKIILVVVILVPSKVNAEDDLFYLDAINDEIVLTCNKQVFKESISTSIKELNEWVNDNCGLEFIE